MVDGERYHHNMINSYTDNPYIGKFPHADDAFSDAIMDVVHKRFHDEQGAPGVPNDDTSEAFDEWLDTEQGKAICAYFATLFPNCDVTYTGHGYEIVFNNPAFTPVN